MVAPRAAQVAARHPFVGRQAAVDERQAARQPLPRRSGRHVGVGLRADLAAGEERRGGAEDEVGRSLDVAILERHPRVVGRRRPLAVSFAVEVERILVAEEAAAHEAQVRSERLHGHGLSDASRRILEGHVLDRPAVGAEIDRRRARRADVAAQQARFRGVVVPRNHRAAHAVEADVAFGLRDGDLLAVDPLREADRRRRVEIGHRGDRLGQGEEIARAVPGHHQVGDAQVGGELGQPLAHGIGHHARNDVGAADVEVRVVLATVGVERRGARGHPHEIAARGLVAQFAQPRLGRPLQFEQRDLLFGRHAAHAVGVDPVGLQQVPLCVEMAAGDGGQQHGDAPLLARLADVAAQVLGELFGLGAHGGLVHLLVVVAELDEDVVARLHAVENRLPAAFVAERLGRAAVHGMVLHRHLLVEEGAEKLSPAALGILFFKALVGAGRVADQVAAGRPRKGLAAECQHQRERKHRHEPDLLHVFSHWFALRPTGGMRLSAARRPSARCRVIRS